jgi:hypothetical protein
VEGVIIIFKLLIKLIFFLVSLAALAVLFFFCLLFFLIVVILFFYCSYFNIIIILVRSLARCFLACLHKNESLAVDGLTQPASNASDYSYKNQNANFRYNYCLYLQMPGSLLKQHK